MPKLEKYGHLQRQREKMIMLTVKKGVHAHSHKQVCVSKPLDSIVSVRHSPQRNLRVECINHACLKPNKCY
jgi:hypothetical protein